MTGLKGSPGEEGMPGLPGQRGEPGMRGELTLGLPVCLDGALICSKVLRLFLFYFLFFLLHKQLDEPTAFSR